MVSNNFLNFLKVYFTSTAHFIINTKVHCNIIAKYCNSLHKRINFSFIIIIIIIIIIILVMIFFKINNN